MINNKLTSNYYFFSEYLGITITIRRNTNDLKIVTVSDESSAYDQLKLLKKFN